jgi:hypothetical protein
MAFFDENIAIVLLHPGSFPSPHLKFDIRDLVIGVLSVARRRWRFAHVIRLSQLRTHFPALQLCNTASNLDEEVECATNSALCEPF